MKGQERVLDLGNYVRNIVILDKGTQTNWCQKDINWRSYEKMRRGGSLLGAEMMRSRSPGGVDFEGVQPTIQCSSVALCRVMLQFPLPPSQSKHYFQFKHQVKISSHLNNYAYRCFFFSWA